jgi:phosphoribosylformylglycinamidine synthase
MPYEKRVQSTIRELVRAKIVESAHDLSDGGLAVALAECSFGGIGADITLESSIPATQLLFHEGPSRILVSTATPAAVLEIARKNDIQVHELGVTLKGKVAVRNRTDVYFDCAVDELKQIWETSFEHLLHTPVTVA